eukprot:scaffold8960_cov32-Prasinocladus_malaysianus.AAC.1
MSAITKTARYHFNVSQNCNGNGPAGLLAVRHNMVSLRWEQTERYKKWKCHTHLRPAQTFATITRRGREVTSPPQGA